MKSDSQSMLEASSRSTNNDQVEEHNAAAQTAELSRTNVQGKDDGESVVSSIDASDMQVPDNIYINIFVLNAFQSTQPL